MDVERVNKEKVFKEIEIIQNRVGNLEYQLEEFGPLNSRRDEQLEKIDMQLVSFEGKLEDVIKKSEMLNVHRRTPVMMNRLAIPDENSLSPSKSTKSLKDVLYPAPSQ